MRIGSLIISVLFAVIAVAIPVAAYSAEATAQAVPALDMLPAWAGYVVAVLLKERCFFNHVMLIN